MGKIYCTECGTELDDSVKFCSSCGTSVNNNHSVSKVDSTDDIMERIETKLLVLGIILVVVFHVIGIFTYNVTILLAITLVPFIVGYLSNESIKLVIIYAILLSFVSNILYCMFPNGFISMQFMVLIIIFMILFSFMGNFIKVKLKS